MSATGVTVGTIADADDPGNPAIGLAAFHQDSKCREVLPFEIRSQPAALNSHSEPYAIPRQGEPFVTNGRSVLQGVGVRQESHAPGVVRGRQVVATAGDRVDTLLPKAARRPNWVDPVAYQQ